MMYLALSLLTLSGWMVKCAVASSKGWINVKAYDAYSPTCDGLSSGYASYATGVCLLGKYGSYKYVASTSPLGLGDVKISYTYTNYTDTACAVVDKVLSYSFTEGACTLRTPVSSDDFNFPHYYTYAEYTYTAGSAPTNPPYSGVVKTYFANTTCGAAYEYKLKMFNQAYCFDTIYGTPYPGGAKYNCDGTVTSYTNNTCQKQSPPRSTKTPTLVPSSYPSFISNTPSVAPVVKPTYPTPAVPNVCTAAPNGYSTEQTCYTAVSLPPASSPSSSSSCFAGSEMVLLESGEEVAIDSVKLGDRVLVSSAATNGERTLEYSPVVAVPHKSNQMQATFIHLVATDGTSIKLTPEHLILAGKCGSTLSLTQAAAVTPGQCLLNQAGQIAVSSSEKVTGHGVYTIVTRADALLVVNGFVASPFAVNHQVASAFYSIHRLLFGVLPSLGASQLLTRSFETFGNLFGSN